MAFTRTFATISKLLAIDGFDGADLVPLSLRLDGVALEVGSIGEHALREDEFDWLW